MIYERADAMENADAAKEICHPNFFWTWTSRSGKDSLKAFWSSSTRYVLMVRARTRRMKINLQCEYMSSMNLRLWLLWKKRILLGQKDEKRIWIPTTTGGMNGRSLNKVIEDPPTVKFLKFPATNLDTLRMVLPTFQSLFPEFFSIFASLLSELPALTE